METCPKDHFEMVEVRIIRSGEGKVMGGQGVEFGRWRAQDKCFWIRETGYLWEVKALVRLVV